MIKNVIFDLGGVILKNQPDLVLDKFDLSMEERCNAEKFFFDFKELDLGYEDLLQHYNTCCFDIDMSERVKNILLHYYKYRDYDDEIMKIIDKLVLEGYRVYIFSNNNIEAFRYLKEQLEFKNITGWVISSSYNILKPDKRLYDILLCKYSINPDECLFIDDSLENVIMGENLGIKSFKYDGDNVLDLCEFLKINGVNIS